MNILLFIGIVCFGYLWAGKVDFIEDAKNLIGLGQDSQFHTKYDFINYIYYFIHKIFNCYCITPYIIFFMTFNFWLALIGYVCAELLTKIIDLINSKITY